jgi:alkanesulfonate monooxygenase SsuD/methylene tetrahydromethanopterin reductase-like flavin-dependent oxidoreductase (luciferase family)
MATDGAPVGVLIMSTTPPAQIPRLATSAERLGFRQLWVAEDYFFLGGIAAAAMCLGATERLPVGIGIMSALARHPAVTAQELATLVGAYPGRLMPGIGLGVPGWVEQMGLTPASSLTAIRECVQSLRTLLGGETLSVEGKQFAFREVRLTHPPADPPPLLTGAMQPKSLELSGEIADGNVIGAMAPVEYVAWSLERIAAGAARAGRTGLKPMTPLFALYNCGPDRAAARAELRGTLAFYLAVWPRNAFTEMVGCVEELEDMVARGGAETVAREMPDEWIDRFAIAGDPDECAARLAAYIAAGADCVVLAPYDGARSAELFETAARDVLPRL